MECDICGKPGQNAPLHCITCARSAIELPRIELARCLIDRDRVAKHVKAVVEGLEDKESQHVSLSDSKGGLLVDRFECTRNVELQRARAETAEIEEHTQLIADHATSLRAQMEETRKEIEAKRASIAQRKSDLSSATYGIDARRANEADKVQQNIKRMDYKNDKVHHDTREMRTYLCRTAAKLAGLKITQRRSKDTGKVREVYNIGPGNRLRIYDLQELHDAQPDNLSASLGAVSQLLVRVAGYLGVRLPAEITMPHNEYPQPTIFRPTSSYLGKNVSFPTPSGSSSNSPEASKTLESQVPLPKPRTLCIDRPLPHLAAQDPQAYSLFLEGISLLAYDVAWLCRTQGLKDDFPTWESVSSMGRNLYRLLILQETRASARPENPLDKDIIPSKPHSKTIPTRAPVVLGELSHATSHSFMNNAENAYYLGGWKLTPTKIADELRAFLLGEQQAQEWAVVDQTEWDDMENMLADDPVVVGEKRRENAGLDDGRSYLTSTTAGVRSVARIDVDDDRAEERRRGTSGWTKLKSRTDEPVKEAASK
jgi:hypothetical protein